MLLVVSYSRKWHSIAITIAIAIAILFHRGIDIAIAILFCKNIGIAIAIFLICIANIPDCTCFQQSHRLNALTQKN